MSLTNQQVMELEGYSERTLFYRLKAGVLRRLEDGSIDPASLSPKARRLLFQQDLKTAAPAGSQPNLFFSDKIAALQIPEAQKLLVQKRVDIVESCINGNWRAAGYRRKRDFVYQLADQSGISGRNLERWIKRYTEAGKDAMSLVDRKPGPEPAGAHIEDWMCAFLQNRYLFKKWNLRQCYDALLSEIRRKQAAWDVAHIYSVPSYDRVRRYLRSLTPIEEAARGGPERLKAALGYVDRKWTDIHSLDRVDVDEWITDAYAYDPLHAGEVGRYYLLTFLDARSLYPLVWHLVEQPNEDDELDLLVALIENYGVPGMIHSDRGRYRGRTFGGQYRDLDRKKTFARVDGILDRLGVRHNMGFEHNPRASRLERFHKELANFARTLPGWLGANTEERKMTSGDAQKAEHLEWVKGRRESTPLLSRDEMLEKFSEFMSAWRERPSDGNGMNGLSPARVFEDSKPHGGFRRLSEAELAWHTAQHFPGETIEPGGVITLPDKKRYHHPLLLLIQGEQRECVRLRTDISFISVLPVRKGEEAIIAPLRQRVGNTDPAALAAAHAEQGSIRKAVAEYLNHYAGSEQQERARIIPRAADAIPARDFFPTYPNDEEAAVGPSSSPRNRQGEGLKGVAVRPPTSDEREEGGSRAAADSRGVSAAGDASPATTPGSPSVGIEVIPQDESPLPSLYDDGELTVESL